MLHEAHTDLLSMGYKQTQEIYFLQINEVQKMKVLIDISSNTLCAKSKMKFLFSKTYMTSL